MESQTPVSDAMWGCFLEDDDAVAQPSKEQEAEELKEEDAEGEGQEDDEQENDEEVEEGKAVVDEEEQAKDVEPAPLCDDDAERALLLKGRAQAMAQRKHGRGADRIVESIEDVAQLLQGTDGHGPEDYNDLKSKASHLLKEGVPNDYLIAAAKVLGYTLGPNWFGRSYSNKPAPNKECRCCGRPQYVGGVRVGCDICNPWNSSEFCADCHVAGRWREHGGSNAARNLLGSNRQKIAAASRERRISHCKNNVCKCDKWWRIGKRGGEEPEGEDEGAAQDCRSAADIIEGELAMALEREAKAVDDAFAPRSHAIYAKSLEPLWARDIASGRKFFECVANTKRSDGQFKSFDAGDLLIIVENGTRMVTAVAEIGNDQRKNETNREYLYAMLPRERRTEIDAFLDKKNAVSFNYVQFSRVLDLQMMNATYPDLLHLLGVENNNPLNGMVHVSKDAAVHARLHDLIKEMPSRETTDALDVD